MTRSYLPLVLPTSSRYLLVQVPTRADDRRPFRRFDHAAELDDPRRKRYGLGFKIHRTRNRPWRDARVGQMQRCPRTRKRRPAVCILTRRGGVLAPVACRRRLGTRHTRGLDGRQRKPRWHGEMCRVLECRKQPHMAMLAEPSHTGARGGYPPHTNRTIYTPELAAVPPDTGAHAVYASCVTELGAAGSWQASRTAEAGVGSFRSSTRHPTGRG